MDDGRRILDPHRRLYAVGWSIGVAAFAPDVWIVSGTNGENLIRADAPTQAWRAAMEQAKSLGMLGPIRPGEPGTG